VCLAWGADFASTQNKAHFLIGTPILYFSSAPPNNWYGPALATWGRTRRAKVSAGKFLLRFGKWSRLGQWHVLKNTTLTSYFYKKYLLKTNICSIFLWKYFARQSYSCSFHISKLNDLKVTNDLYSQCLTKTLFKTTSFTKLKGGKPCWLNFHNFSQQQAEGHQCIFKMLARIAMHFLYAGVSNVVGFTIVLVHNCVSYYRFRHQLSVVTPVLIIFFAAQVQMRNNLF
jgi:hypothetical protein